uniref:Uncharacterized protein n=1 Tax=Panagrolaimus sp. ES5 TaxID=591445 RepID=A0AC34GL08_9BILA
RTEVFCPECASPQPGDADGTVGLLVEADRDPEIPKIIKHYQQQQQSLQQMITGYQHEQQCYAQQHQIDKDIMEQYRLKTSTLEYMSTFDAKQVT